MLTLLGSLSPRKDKNETVTVEAPLVADVLGPPQWQISEEPIALVNGQAIPFGRERDSPFGKLAFIIFTYDAKTMEAHPEALKVLDKGAWRTANTLPQLGFPTAGYGVGPLYTKGAWKGDYVGQQSHVSFPAANLERVREALTNMQGLLPASTKSAEVLPTPGATS